MRVVTVGKRNLEIRGLTPDEIKKLNKKGLPIYRHGIDVSFLLNDPQLGDRVLDAIYKTILTDKDAAYLKTLGIKQERKVFRAVYSETYGNGDEEKNLPMSGNTTQTKAN